MAYKEGKDFEWVPMKDKDGKVVKDGRGGAVKTRRFFTKAEKEAMKSGGKPKAKPKSKPKSSVSSSAPKSTTTKPQARRTDTKALSNPPAVEERNLSSTRGGRGDGVAEMARRALDRPNNGAKADQAKTKLLRSAGINYDTWEKMTRPERREAGLPETTVGWQNQSLINDPIGWMKKQLGLTAKTGMSAGGMVMKGNKDYKKSGMFYKSGSPRGYK